MRRALGNPLVAGCNFNDLNEEDRKRGTGIVEKGEKRVNYNKIWEEDKYLTKKKGKDI